MKKLLLIFGAILITSIGITNAQTLGTKKNITLKIVGLECGDLCFLELKDIVTGKTYTILDNMDEKTKDNGIIEAIKDIYYRDGESDKRLIGKIYKATIEYRTTEIIEYDITGDGTKTGKKETKWMINSLSR